VSAAARISAPDAALNSSATAKRKQRVQLAKFLRKMSCYTRNISSSFAHHRRRPVARSHTQTIPVA